MSRFKMDRVCIVMMTAVGDAVHVLPVITALKRHKPDCHITWVLQPGPARLVRGHDAIDEILLFEKAKGARAFLDIRRELRQREFDIALGLQVYFKAGLITSFVRAPVKVGFDLKRARDANFLFTNHRIPAHPQQHVQDQYFEFLQYIGVPHEPVEWRLGPWPHEHEEQRAFAAQFDRPIASLVIGTSKPEKDWLPERWAQLCDVLYEDYGLQPVIVGGPSPREKATTAAIMAAARHKPVSTLGASLRALVGILDASALVVSLDTGPLHMSVALDRPVISLMGYNNPKRVGPYRRYHDLIVDAYGDPGEDYPVTPAHRHDRMPRITVDDVVEKVETWKRRYAGKAAAAGGRG